MNKRIVIPIALIAVLMGLLTYYHCVPLVVSVVSTGAFIAGIAAGWYAKVWTDKHIVK